MGYTASSRGSAVLCWLLAVLLPLTVFGNPCHKVKFSVPDVIHSNALVGKVHLQTCMHPNEVIAGSNNQSFAVEHVESMYGIYSTKRITMPSHAVSFGIIVLDLTTLTERIIKVKLVPEKKIGKSRIARELLKRTKRRWRPMPFSVQENYRGKFPAFVQQVQSDTQQDYEILYSIRGQGVDQPPVGLFLINAETGDIFITGPVDREEYSSFQMVAYAETKTGYSPEIPLELPVIVEDDNDNAPQFTEELFCAEVLEHSKSGAIVGRVNATDRDDPNTRHTLLAYYLIRQLPPTSPPMFAVNQQYGIVTTVSNQLNREVQDQYTLIIEVRDMGGGIGCLTSTGTMSITILDINDYPPTFTMQSYRTEVNENESGMVILKIPVTDKDLVNTANWRAVYTITQGNEKGHFNISTDPNTNEGLLRVIKGINYEEDQQFLLQVAVANEVSLITQSGTKSSGVSTVPVTVIVRDVDEGPECQPRIKEVRVRENQTIGTLVTDYQAIDPETKGSSGIRYTKLSDPQSWVNIAEGSGRITIAKVLDYESSDTPKQYNVTFLATDQTGKSGTCTLSIVVEDVNDNIPVLPRSDLTVCNQGRTSVVVQAEDADSSSHTSPFFFSLDGSKDANVNNNWKITQQDGHSAQIEHIGNNPNGPLTIPVRVTDGHGLGSTQMLRVTKCDCPDSLNCASRSSGHSAALGGLAILVMVLSALLFAAFLCAIMACLCGAGASKGKLGFPDDAAQQNLIVTNTEAPGADVMDQNFKIPVHIANPNVSGSGPSGSNIEGGQNVNQVIIQQVTTGVKRPIGSNSTGQYTREQHLYDSNRHTYAEWQSYMNNHLVDKLYMCGQDEEHQHGEDYVVPYNYEGKGSVAGSVGCCSDLQREEDRLDFLNTLEPKFRTLADVCTKK
ncbi:desmocollin-3-like [Pseudophryne corroboree]|uniref:desmocollin-3-like n=1 Tax=Pseudophryne corroboree TaxID=495146 RepID=UPI0030813C6A